MRGRCFGQLGVSGESMRQRISTSILGPAFVVAWITLLIGDQVAAGPRFPIIGESPPMPPQIARRTVKEVKVQKLASRLQIPWQLRFAPDGRLFITERPGRILVMRPGRRGLERPAVYLNLESVVARGEGGLMGMALHPDFARQPFLYVMYTTAGLDGLPINRISRLRDLGTTAGEERVLLDGIPASQLHNGGAVEFGPDGHLYIGTGDARLPDSSQELSSLNGKILRITSDGEIPADNPFSGSPVWAYGFRNVSGLAWHPVSRELWAASHGPSGEFENLFHRDTIFRVRVGRNHGWPLVVGLSDDPDLVPPTLYYPTSAVPPGGLMFCTSSVFPALRHQLLIPSLGSMHLQRVAFDAAFVPTEIERWWPQVYGRMRAITQGPDGALYLATSNRDGRAPAGRYTEGDWILKVTPRGGR